MWKLECRFTTERRGLRDPSDLTDAERALVAPLIPPARRDGRRRLSGCEGDSQRHLPCAFDGPPMAGVAEGLAAQRTCRPRARRQAARRVRKRCNRRST